MIRRILYPVWAFLFTLGIVLSFAATKVAAQQQPPCAERAGVLKHLHKNHNETPKALGMTSTGHVMELLVSDKGTWTLMVTRPNGVSCLVSAGDNWMTVKGKVLVPGQDG